MPNKGITNLIKVSWLHPDLRGRSGLCFIVQQVSDILLVNPDCETVTIQLADKPDLIL